MQQQGLFESDILSDRVVFLFVFVPILRHELQRYVKTHNSHSIRPQKQRANHIPGIPDDLYLTSPEAERCGFQPNQTLLSHLEEAVSYVGEHPASHRSKFSDQSFTKVK